jgi:hypothetical protein
MAYGYARNSGIPRLNTYAEALAHCNNVVPIRGRKVEVKPLGYRTNSRRYSMFKTPTDAIECRLYDIPVVIYNPDNTIEIGTYHYTSTSTSNFIDDVLRGTNIRARLTDHSIVVSLYGTKVQQRVPKYIRQIPEKDALGVAQKRLLLTQVHPNQGNYQFAEIEKEITHRINRKEANIVRDKYKGLYTYIRGIAKLMQDEVSFNGGQYQATVVDGIIDVSSNRYQYDDFAQKIQSFMELANDTDETTKLDSYHKVYQSIRKSFGMYDWRTKGRTLSAKGAMTGLEYVMQGVYRSTMLELCETKDNSIIRDKFKKYWVGGWAEFHKDTNPITLD